MQTSSLKSTANTQYLDAVDREQADREWRWQSRKRAAVESLIMASELSCDQIRFGEIGCRDGRATRHFADFLGASEAHGFEVGDTPLVQAADRGVITHLWIVGETECPIGPGSLDVVLAMDVIEHLHDPELFLQAIHKALAPGGSLVMTTPNIAWWWSRIQVLRGRQPNGAPGVSPQRAYDPRCDPKHLRLGTLSEWCAIVAEQGFEIGSTKGYNYPRHLLPVVNLFDDLLAKVPCLAHSIALVATKPTVPSQGGADV